MFDLKFWSPFLALIIACLEFGFGSGNALGARNKWCQ